MKLVTALTILHLISAVGLIVVVLLQSGKSAGLGGAITGGAEQMMGSEAKGMDAFLSRLTTGLAVAFMLLSIGLVVYG